MLIVILMFVDMFRNFGTGESRSSVYTLILALLVAVMAITVATLDYITKYRETKNDLIYGYSTAVFIMLFWVLITFII